jgi:NAD(P)-dependent dehydrogenase (short-subunit alcohol dehydrogenase family)
MSKQIDLSGQVALVTGGGRGIGRAHAEMLAARGAAVVVNDVGVEIDGDGRDGAVAEVVAEAIRKSGGSAISSTADIATEQGGAELASTAIDAFGRIDAFVHNAGIVLAAPFADEGLEQVRRVLEVHLMAGWYVGQPVWRQMMEQRYGRIVFTASGAVFGHPSVRAYAAAKMGLIGLSKCLALEALQSDLDIKVNTICPIGATRMARDTQKKRFGDLMDPANVSAVVTYLLSSQCPVTGEVLHAGGSHAARIFLAMSRGWASGRTGLQPEEVAANWEEVMSTESFSVPKEGNAMTDAIFERATGKADKLDWSEVIPEALRKREEDS